MYHTENEAEAQTVGEYLKMSTSQYSISITYTSCDMQLELSDNQFNMPCLALT